MAKKTTKVSTESTVDATEVEAAVEFTPCRQCGNPGSCARAAKCSKGFK